MNSILETTEAVLETLETVPAVTAPPPPPGPVPVIMVNDWVWLMQEFNRIYDADQVIICFLVFFSLVIVLRYTYKFFRIFF